MSDELSRLLREEAGGIEVPPVLVAAPLRAGRRLRRRRRATSVAAAAAVLAVVAGGALATDRLRAVDDGGDGDQVTFSMDRYESMGALAVDGELYVAGRHIPFSRAVKSFYYTSVGVVVRSGTSPWTDD